MQHKELFQQKKGESPLKATKALETYEIILSGYFCVSTNLFRYPNDIEVRREKDKYYDY